MCEGKLLEKQTQDISLFSFPKISSESPFSPSGMSPLLITGGVCENADPVFWGLSHVSLPLMLSNLWGFFL